MLGFNPKSHHHAFDPSHTIHPSCQITTQIARQVVDKPRLRIIIKKSSLYGHNKKQQQLVSGLFTTKWTEQQAEPGPVDLTGRLRLFRSLFIDCRYFVLAPSVMATQLLPTNTISTCRAIGTVIKTHVFIFVAKRNLLSLPS